VVEAAPNGMPETAAAGVGDAADPRFLDLPGVNLGHGVVAAVVVHRHDLELDVLGSEPLDDGVQGRSDIAFFVVAGDDDREQHRNGFSG
jgi:hypothetical protein